MKNENGDLLACFHNNVIRWRPFLWSSGQFLATDPESRVRFPALPKKSSGSGTGSTQPREYN
jgi:hypothetical protein